MLLQFQDDNDEGLDYDNEPAVRDTFIDSCRALHTLEVFIPHSVQVLVLSKNAEAHCIDDCQHSPILEMMLGISLLSCTELSFNDAEIFDIPSWILYNFGNINFSTAFLETGEESLCLVEFTERASSKQPVEATYRMYEKLLRYAQYFEMFLPFSQEMSSIIQRENRSMKYEDSLEKGGRDITVEKGQAIALVEQLSESSRTTQLLRGLKLSNVRNSFKSCDAHDKWHPGERLLAACENVSEHENVTSFKQLRNELLPLIEEHYQQVQTSFFNLNQFIKKQKRPGGLFDVELRYEVMIFHQPPPHAMFPELMHLLESCVKSFDKLQHSPPLNCYTIQGWQDIFDKVYSTHPAFVKVRRLKGMLTRQHYSQSMANMCEVIDALDVIHEDRAGTKRVVHFQHHWSNQLPKNHYCSHASRKD